MPNWKMNSFLGALVLVILNLMVVSDVVCRSRLLRTEKTLRNVNEDNLMSHLQDTFSKARSYQQPEEWQRVRQEIINYFNDLLESDDGVATDSLNIHDFQSVFEVDSSSVNVTGTNIALTMQGSATVADRKVVVIGTHYDSQINTPGVDDNGSGMAALLEIARLLFQARKDCPFQNTIVLVAFDLEEFGLLGSRAWVDEYLVPSVLEAEGIQPDNFYGAFILETIMNWDDTPNSQLLPPGFGNLLPEVDDILEENEYRGDFLASIGRRDDGPLVDIMDKWWMNVTGGTTTGVPYKVIGESIELFSGLPSDLPDNIFNLIRDIFRSDHYNFWDYNSTTYGLNTGLKAVFLTDTANFRGYMQDCYHTPCDSIDKITEKPERLEFLSVIAEVVFRASLSVTADDEQLSCWTFDVNGSSILTPGAFMISSMATLLVMLMKRV